MTTEEKATFDEKMTEEFADAEEKLAEMKEKVGYDDLTTEEKAAFDLKLLEMKMR